LYLQYGDVSCSSVNLTNNDCDYYTALGCSPTGRSGFYTCCILYSSIINNSAQSVCIKLSNVSSTQKIDTCNILNNINTYSYGSTLKTDANLLIRNSCILGNIAKNVFYQTSSSKKITISNCTIDDDIFTDGRYTGSVTITKTIERSFINALSHMATRICESSYVECSRSLVSCNFRAFGYKSRHMFIGLFNN
jgi:hypothetical protein